jgi:hypothetical protein
LKLSRQLAAGIWIGPSVQQPLDDRRRRRLGGVGGKRCFDTPSIVRLDGSQYAVMQEYSLRLRECLFSLTNPHQNEVAKNERHAGGAKGQVGGVSE